METRDVTRDATRDDRTPSAAPSRRDLFSGGTLARAAGAATAAALLSSRSHAAIPLSSCRLIVVFLRGAIDALSCVFPTGDAEYQARRQDLALADPVPQQPGSLRLDANFGLNEAAQPLFAPYRNGDLAFALGVGSPELFSLSHFASQDYAEYGTFDDESCNSDGKGWLGRYLSEAPPSTLDLDGLALGTSVPKTLRGGPRTVAVPDPLNFDLNGLADSVDLRKTALELIHQQAEDPVKSAGLDSLAVIDGLKQVDFDPLTAYPTHPFGTALSQVAAILRDPNEVGARGCVLDFGGWDDHADQGPTLGPGSSGKYYERLQVLAHSLRAFYDEMRSTSVDYQLLVMSEFGRRIDMNNNLGSDHGRGGLMIAMGSAGVNGGQVYTRTGLPGATAPGWDPAGLVNHFDPIAGGGSTENLLCNISWWDVIAEALVRRCGVPIADVGEVFPCYPYAPLGMFA